MNNMYHSVGSFGWVVYAKVKVHLSGSSRLRGLRAREQRLSSWKRDSKFQTNTGDWVKT